MKLRSRAPVRIDFAGGWSDVALFCEQTPGCVVNAAISLYSYVSVNFLPKDTVEMSEYGYRTRYDIDNNGVKIYSADFDIYHEATDIKDLEYNGSIDLIKAVVKQLGVKGIEIVTRCDAPAGSGLGSSASMGVALCGAILQANRLDSDNQDQAIFPIEYAMMSCRIEQEELGILGGSQDQLASAYGGINLMEFNVENPDSFGGEKIHVSSVPMEKDVLYELQKSLVLCYTGKSRLSGDIHRHVMQAYMSGNKQTKHAITELTVIAQTLSRVLYLRQLEEFGPLLHENWRKQKELHPSVSTPEMDAIYDLAMRNGATGGKACGAGGGGCMVFYCPDAEHLVRKKLIETGVQILDFHFDFDGLQTWMV